MTRLVCRRDAVHKSLREVFSQKIACTLQDPPSKQRDRNLEDILVYPKLNLSFGNNGGEKEIVSAEE